MNQLISSPFNFHEFKKVWNSGGLSEDIDIVSNLTENNPLLHQTLYMQGNVLAILDIKTMQYTMILGDVEKVCGWSKEYLYNVGVEGYVNKFLPNDLLGLGEISKLINTYLSTLTPEETKKFMSIYDYQMYGEDGRVRRVCQEGLPLKTDSEGHIVYLMAYASDITHFKRAGKQHLYLSGGENSRLIEIDNETNCYKELVVLSKREQEIAKLLGKGLVSEQIAEQLFISVNTVNTHRQNMLRKLGLVVTTELVNFLKIYRLI